jgi:hypothetical protein
VRSGARAEPEQGDDRWGPPVSQARRGAKAGEVICFLVREAAIGQGATDAQSTGARGRARPVKRPRPSGERGRGRLDKKSGPRLGPIQVIKPFHILFEFQIFGKL